MDHSRDQGCIVYIYAVPQAQLHREAHRYNFPNFTGGREEISQVWNMEPKLEGESSAVIRFMYVPSPSLTSLV